MQTGFLQGVGLGLGDKKIFWGQYKSNRSQWKVPTIHRNKRVCVCSFMWFMRTNLYYDRYYKQKVIYENIFSVPIIQNSYKSYRVSFFGGK